MTRLTSLAAAALVAVLFLSPGDVRAQQSLGSALRAGRTTVDLRLRSELVTDDRFDENAVAHTVRTSLKYASSEWRGFSGVVEAEAVASILGGDSFNNAGAGRLSNGVTDRPAIADPNFAEINQAYAGWQGSKTFVTVGRQEIVLGDARFVGNVGWRQNHQSYDAAVLRTAIGSSMNLTYAYLARTHRVFGDDKPMASHVASLRSTVGPVGELDVFGQLLDYTRAADDGLSTLTIGARLNGIRKAGEYFEVPYKAGFAIQTDAGENPADYAAQWFTAEASLKVRGRTQFSVGFERLGADEGQGRFITPLATLHAYNGWADQFLATPANGLDDLYATLSTKVSKVTAGVTYHDFKAAEGDMKYGHEIDVQLTTTVPAGPDLGLKLAWFDGSGATASVTKAWLWAAYRF